MNNKDVFSITKNISEHNLIIKTPKNPDCPKCGNSEIYKWGKYFNKKQILQRYKCKKCGYVWTKK